MEGGREGGREAGGKRRRRRRGKRGIERKEGGGGAMTYQGSCHHQVEASDTRRPSANSLSLCSPLQRARSRPRLHPCPSLGTRRTDALELQHSNSASPAKLCALGRKCPLVRCVCACWALRSRERSCADPEAHFLEPQKALACVRACVRVRVRFSLKLREALSSTMSHTSRFSRR